MNNEKRRAYMQLGVAMALAGSSVVVGKLIIANLPVFLIGALRFGVASIVLVPMLWYQGGTLKNVLGKNFFLLLIQAFFGVFLFNILMLNGLKHTTAASGGIITSTMPAVAGILSVLVLKEKMRLQVIIAIAFAILGILAINLAGSGIELDSFKGALLGNLMVFGAVISEAIFIILGKTSSRNLSPLAITTGVSIMGFLMFLPMAAVEGSNVDFTIVTVKNWGQIVYYGLFVTVISFILWYRGLAKVPAGEAAVFSGLFPVTAIILSYFFLFEQIYWLHAIGLLFVFISIVFLAVPSKTEG